MKKLLSPLALFLVLGTVAFADPGIKPIAHIGWGNSDSQIGRLKLQNSFWYPMVFSFDPLDRIVIPDFVNGKIKTFGKDGKIEAVVSSSAVNQRVRYFDAHFEYFLIMDERYLYTVNKNDGTVYSSYDLGFFFPEAIYTGPKGLHFLVNNDGNRYTLSTDFRYSQFNKKVLSVGGTSVPIVQTPTEKYLSFELSDISSFQYINSFQTQNAYYLAGNKLSDTYVASSADSKIFYTAFNLLKTVSRTEFIINPVNTGDYVFLTFDSNLNYYSLTFDDTGISVMTYVFD